MSNQSEVQSKDQSEVHLIEMFQCTKDQYDDRENLIPKELEDTSNNFNKEEN